MRLTESDRPYLEFFKQLFNGEQIRFERLSEERLEKFVAEVYNSSTSKTFILEKEVTLPARQIRQLIFEQAETSELAWTLYESSHHRSGRLALPKAPQLYGKTLSVIRSKLKSQYQFTVRSEADWTVTFHALVVNSLGDFEESTEFVGPRIVNCKAGTTKQYKIEVFADSTVEVTARETGVKIVLYS